MESYIDIRQRYRYIIDSLLILTAIAVMVATSQAQSTDYQTGPAPAINWSKTYKFQDYGGAESICPTADGGYAITGITCDIKQDVFLIKTTAGGELQWSQTYGGPDYDNGRCVIQAPDGSYAIAGYRSSTLNDNTDIYLLKTDAQGKQLWSRTLGDIGQDHGNAVIATDGGYLLAGDVYGGLYGYNVSDGYLARFSADGDQLWARRYIEPGAYAELFYALRETAGGGYIIAGTVSNTVGKIDERVCLVKVDRDGNQTWFKSYDAEGKVGDVRQTVDGGYIVTGGGYDKKSLFLLRTDGDGNALWHKEYDIFGQLSTGTVEQLSDGGFIAGGACLVRTDGDGNLLWSELTDAGFDFWRTGVVANSDGSYTVTGGLQTVDNTVWPALVRTMPGDKGPVAVTPTPGHTQAATPAADMGWIATAGLALGIFVLIAGVIVVLLIIVLIVDEHRNKPRRPERSPGGSQRR